MIQCVGNWGRAIVAQLEPGADLLESIITIAREQKIRTGVVSSITGAISRATLQHFSPNQEKAANLIDVMDIEGPLECSGHGIIGEVSAPEMGSKPFGVGKYVHGTPYVHVHLTVTSHRETICGHLMPGCLVWSKHPISHFTIMLAEITGVSLEMTTDATLEATGAGRGVFHRVTQLAR
jgi:predicted DNA-binding protein with PD1-like motif